MYSKEYLRQQIKAAFDADDVEGDLTDLVADVLAEYAYLHQIIDINILMENSFLRSRKLNSRIQQAADRFYSVDRGHNRLIKINNLSVYKDASTIYPLQIITQNAGGKYKLYAAEQWKFEAGSQLTATGYLALDSVELQLQGNNKLYIDIETTTNNVQYANQNISENLVVYQTWAEDPNILGVTQFQDNSTNDGLYFKKIDVVSSLSELFSREDECFCAMTLPNYGVRLFSKTIIDSTKQYLIRYLVCPDPTVEEKDPASSIKNINNCKITNDTSFEVLRTTQYRLEDLDAIYLYASNNLKMGGVLKSITSLETVIPEVFPEFKSYKMLIGPISNTYNATSNDADNVVLHDVVSVSSEYEVQSQSSDVSSSIIDYVPNGAIYIWYVLDDQVTLKKNSNEEYPANHYEISTDQLNEWKNKAKAYYIPDSTQFFFRNINELPEDSPDLPIHVKGLSNYKIKIYYSQNIDYQRVRDIVESFQYQIGEDFNPYKIISALVTDSALYGKIRYVEILHNNSPAEVLKMPQDQRWMFTDEYTSLVEFQQV